MSKRISPVKSAATPTTNPEPTAPKLTGKGHDQDGFAVSGPSPGTTPTTVAETQNDRPADTPTTTTNAVTEPAKSPKKQNGSTPEPPDRQKELRAAVRALSKTQKDAIEAQGYCAQLVAYFRVRKGVYLRDENSEISVLVEGKRVAFNRNADNRAFNRILRKVCNITLSTQIAQPTIERLIDDVHDQVSKFKLRKFSAVSNDGKRLYLPLKDDSKLLCITAEKITTVLNGDNEDSFWVEQPHPVFIDPYGDGHSLDYKAGDAKAGLNDFERLVVNPQACRVPEMAWLVGMHECFFPHVRALVKDRFGLHHSGSQGNGKTTGAELCATLHGLQISANISASAIRHAGDIGLLVYDNKESDNTTNAQKEDMVYIATGGLSGRMHQGTIRGSNTHRPVVVLTSIEGLDKKELVSRYIPVDYNAQERSTSLNNTEALAAVREKRHTMLSAFVPVFQRFLQLRQENRRVEVIQEIKRFPEHFSIVVNLLRAYAEIAGKPADWPDSIVQGWRSTISEEKQQSEGGDELTFLCQTFLDAVDSAGSPGTPEEHDLYLQKCVKNHKPVTLHKGTKDEQEGSLTPFVATELLMWLRNKYRYNKELLKAPSQFAKRLRKIKGASFQIVDETSGLEELKRGEKVRLLGFFEPGTNVKPPAPKFALSQAELDALRKAAEERRLKPAAKDAPKPVETVREVFQPEPNPANMN